jgi:NADH:ubiquinone oxidoreductase subunit C
MRELRQLLEQKIADAIGMQNAALTCETNSKGVTIAWCRLKRSEDLLACAQIMKAMEGRLSTITASSQESARQSGTHELAYHFDLDGDTLTVSLQLPLDAEIDSLTPLFRTADWNEREFMELYEIKIRGCLNPERLFLDESIDAGVLDRLVPFSELVNAASTKMLWERILSSREDKQ